jgi:hypothetical protein
MVATCSLMKRHDGVKQVDGALLTLLEKEPDQEAALTAQLERYLLVVKVEPDLLVMLGDGEGVYVCVYVAPARHCGWWL